MTQHCTGMVQVAVGQMPRPIAAGWRKDRKTSSSAIRASCVRDGCKTAAARLPDVIAERATCLT